MSDKHHYKRLDIPRQQYSSVESHMAYAIQASLLSECEHSMLLKQYRRENYFVVGYRTWVSVLNSIYACTPKADLHAIARPAETALYKTAERFDTLEQAMLYYHLVK